MKPNANTWRAVVALLALTISCGPPPRVHPPLPAPSAQRERVADDALRASPPPALPARPSELPTIEAFRLSSGVWVYLVTRASDFASVRVVCRRCGDDDLNVASGVPDVSIHALTTTMHAPAIRNGGARLASSVGMLSAWIGSAVTTEAIPDAVRLLGSLPDHIDDIAVGFSDARQSLLAEHQREPFSLIMDLLASSQFGSSHPYGRRFQMFESSITRMNAADAIVYLHERLVSPENALVVAGNITRAQLQPIAEAAFHDWPSTPVRARLIAPIQSLPARVFLIDTGRRPISLLMAAIPGVRRTDPDFPAMALIEQMLGGSFGSRLNLALRENSGLSYSASASGATFQDAGIITLETRVDAANAFATLIGVSRELSRLRRERVTDRELATAKLALRTELHERFESSSGAASAMATVFAFGQHLDVYTDLERDIENVTAERLHEVASRRLGIAAHYLVTGDRNTLQTPLEENFGIVDVIDARH